MAITAVWGRALRFGEAPTRSFLAVWSTSSTTTRSRSRRTSGSFASGSRRGSYMPLTPLQPKRVWSRDFTVRSHLPGRRAAIGGQGPVWHVPVGNFNGGLSAAQLLLDCGDISDCLGVAVSGPSVRPYRAGERLDRNHVRRFLRRAHDE